MEQTLHDRAPGRDTPPADAAVSPPASVRGPIVRFCSWCKEIAVRGAYRDEDSLIVIVHHGERRAVLNGKDLIIQDGICEKCRPSLWPGKEVAHG
jgi:hypothetical protein